MVAAGDYMWSSHRANTGAIAEPMITPHVEYLALSAGRDSRHRAYAELFEISIETPVLEGIRGATNGGYPLGSAEFKSRVQEDHGRRVERGRPGRPMKQRTDAQTRSP